MSYARNAHSINRVTRIADMIKRAATLSPSQLRHLLRVTGATSRHPERDVLILWLGFSCGMRVTETARLTVADVLMPSGRLRSEISLRAEITKGCRQRLFDYIQANGLPAAWETRFNSINNNWPPSRNKLAGLLLDAQAAVAQRAAK